MALTYFAINEWIFKNDNFVSLCDCIRLTDLKEFDFRDCFNYDVLSYIRVCMIGVKKYLLYDDERNHKNNLVRYKILKVVHQVLGSVPYMVLFYVLMKHNFFGLLVSPQKN